MDHNKDAETAIDVTDDDHKHKRKYDSGGSACPGSVPIEVATTTTEQSTLTAVRTLEREHPDRIRSPPAIRRQLAEWDVDRTIDAVRKAIRSLVDADALTGRKVSADEDRFDATGRPPTEYSTTERIRSATTSVLRWHCEQWGVGPADLWDFDEIREDLVNK